MAAGYWLFVFLLRQFILGVFVDIDNLCCYIGLNVLAIKDFYNYLISIIVVMQCQTTSRNVKSFTYVIGTLETIQKGFTFSRIKTTMQEAIGQLKKMREALNKVNDWENPNCQFQEVTELSEIVKFFREVSADVASYCKKYLLVRSINKDQIKYQAKFWGKVRDVINDAKQKAKQQSKIQKLQQKMIKYKENEFNQQKISALKQVQKIILSGSKQSAYHSYYEANLSYNKGIQILSPVVEDYKKITQVIEKLAAIMDNKSDIASISWESLSQRCLTLVNKLQTQITLKSQQIYNQIDRNWPYGKLCTLDGLFRLISTWKSAIQKKQNPQKIETPKQKKYNVMTQESPIQQKSTKSFSFAFWRTEKQPKQLPQSPTNQHASTGLWNEAKTGEQLKQIQKLKQQIQVEVMTEKIHDIREMLRKQMFKQIGEAAQLRWGDFKDKYSKRLSQNIQLPCENFSVAADDIICKVLKSTALTLQVTKNSSILQLLESGQQKQKTIDQLRLTNAELGVQIEKLQNFIKIQQQEGNIQYENSQGNKAVIRPPSKLKTAQNRVAQLQMQIVHQKKIKQEFAQLNGSLNKRINEVHQDFSRLKQQSRALELNYDKKLKQKQAQIQNLSAVLVSSSNNKSSLKDKQITNLRAKITALTQQVQDQQQVTTALKYQIISMQNQLTKQKQNSTKRYNQTQTYKSKAEELQAENTFYKADIAECIEKAAKIVDNHKSNQKIRTLQEAYEWMAGELKYFKNLQKQYKSLYGEAVAEKNLTLSNIKKIFSDTSINDYTDVENKMKSLLKEKAELESTLKLRSPSKMEEQDSLRLSRVSSRHSKDNEDNMVVGSHKLEKQNKELKEKVQIYQKNIKILKQQNQKLIKKCQNSTQITEQTHKLREARSQTTLLPPLPPTSPANNRASTINEKIKQVNNLKSALNQKQELIKQVTKKLQIAEQETHKCCQQQKKAKSDLLKLQQTLDAVYRKLVEAEKKKKQSNTLSKESQTQIISQQQLQGKGQKKQEHTNLAQFSGTITSVQKEQAKKVQELLTSAQQIKQFYKKLKQKQAKITKIIDEKQKRIAELDELIEKKILQRTNIQYEMSQMSGKIDQIKNMRQEIDKLNRENFKIKEGIENDKLASSKEIEKEKQELAKMRRQSKQAIQKQKQELAKIKGQSTKTKQEVEKTKNAINSALTKRNDIQKQFTAKQKVIRQLADKETKMAQKLKKLEREFEQKNKQLKKMQNVERNVEKCLMNSEQITQNEEISLIKVEQITVKKPEAQLNQVLEKLSEMKQGKVETKKQVTKQNKKQQQVFTFQPLLSQNETDFVVKCLLQINPNSSISQLNLLFRYSPKSNAHNYIDDHPHYVVIVKLKNGHKIALYSEIPLKEDVYENRGKGFIASVTNKKAFYFRKQNQHAVVSTYDSRFIIFGNGEVKLKLEKPSYLKVCIVPEPQSFNTVGEENAEVLVGDTKDKHEVTEYEIFEVIFEAKDK